jgi:hypothetical protein
MSREITNKLLEMVDEGLLDARTLVLACLKYMSEDDVEDMAVINEFIADPNDYEDEEDEAYDFDPEEASCPYVLFGGSSRDNLQPISAWPDRDHAIVAGQSLLATRYTCAEVVYMPEDDLDTNEVVWASYK